MPNENNSTSLTINPELFLDDNTGIITGTINATTAGSPTINVGFVAISPGGEIVINGNNSLQLPVKEAEVIIPNTTNQIINEKQFLIGPQTIVGEPNLIAENIARDITIFGVTGICDGNVLWESRNFLPNGGTEIVQMGKIISSNTSFDSKNNLILEVSAKIKNIREEEV